jgi:nitrite reductase (NADH) large subunit
MEPIDTRAWRCSNCGYVHRGPVPPDSCPICGAPAEDFVPYEEPAARAAAPAAGEWRCLNCHYVVASTAPPRDCPVCRMPGNQFEPLASIGVPPSGDRGPFRALIVGAGIAGVSAAEAIRAASPEAEITLVAGEAGLPYYRLNLTRYLAGEIALDALPIHPPEWYRNARIDLLSEARVESIDLPRRRADLAGRGGVGFDRLVLATGAHPFIPPIQGAERQGVETLRTSHDADRILQAAARGDPVVVIGGGVLGLEAAGALARRGAHVTLLEGHEWLMPRQLDREAGRRLERHVTALGIRLEKHAVTREIAGAARVDEVVLADGRTIPAGVVIVATGVRPNTHLARRAGLDVNQGVLVNHHMMSSADRVFAAGDAAEHNGVLYGTWAASQFQGTIAGMNAAGLAVIYGGQSRSNTLKVLGLDLLSIGTFEPVDGSYVVIEEAAPDRYFRFVLHDGRLVGAILMGDISRGASVKAAIETRLDYSGLLLGMPTAADVIAHSERIPLSAG